VAIQLRFKVENVLFGIGKKNTPQEASSGDHAICIVSSAVGFLVRGNINIVGDGENSGESVHDNLSERLCL